MVPATGLTEKKLQQPGRFNFLYCIEVIFSNHVFILFCADHLFVSFVLFYFAQIFLFVSLLYFV